MTKIWANRLIAGTQAWENVPDFRKESVKKELQTRVAEGVIDAEKYKAITGEDYESGN